jgi:hypothetical protein
MRGQHPTKTLVNSKTSKKGYNAARTLRRRPIHQHIKPTNPQARAPARSNANSAETTNSRGKKLPSNVRRGDSGFVDTGPLLGVIVVGDMAVAEGNSHGASCSNNNALRTAVEKFKHLSTGTRIRRAMRQKITVTHGSKKQTCMGPRTCSASGRFALQ